MQPGPETLHARFPVSVKRFFLVASASKGRNIQGDMLQQHVAARSRSDKWTRAYWRIFVKIFVCVIEFCRRKKLHTNEI